MDSENDKIVSVTWLCTFITLWQYVFGITDTGIDILIKFLKAFFNLIRIHINSFSGIAITFQSPLYFINILVMTKKLTKRMLSV